MGSDCAMLARVLVAVTEVGMPAAAHGPVSLPHAAGAPCSTAPVA